jgi:hypothetical protein
MDSHQSRRARSSAAEYLRHLLADEERYRKRWRVHVTRAAADALHQRAIAQVIAEHLWETGQVEDTVRDLPRQLRDRVSRALSGESLSVQSLVWFVEAFEFSDAHTRALWDRHREDSTQRSHPAAAPLENGVRRPVPSSAYRTRALDEYHQLGPDGLPAVHETLQVIEAVTELDRYTFQFDTASASVEVLRGGRRGPTYPNPEQPGIHAVDILLPAPLLPGATHILAYRTVFHYDRPPPPEFRRMFRKQVRTVAMEVRFHPSRLPVRVWWATWAALDETPAERVPVALSQDGRAHRVIEDAQESIVGFLWDWG